MKIDKYYNNINFIARYKLMSMNHNDFSNIFQGNSVELCKKLLPKFKYNIKYFKKESFYRLEEEINDLTFFIQLMLKGGVVEPMICLKIDNVFCEPDGRFDFICEHLDPNFSRKKYPIPLYGSAEELDEILKQIFSLYEDFKAEVLKSR